MPNSGFNYKDGGLIYGDEYAGGESVNVIGNIGMLWEKYLRDFYGLTPYWYYDRKKVVWPIFRSRQDIYHLSSSGNGYKNLRGDGNTPG